MWKWIAKKIFSQVRNNFISYDDEITHLKSYTSALHEKANGLDRKLDKLLSLFAIKNANLKNEIF